jgi:hypothetical protein
MFDQDSTKILQNAILQAKNVTLASAYTSNGGRAKTITPTSASANAPVVIQTLSSSYSSFIGVPPIESSMLGAGSSSLDVTEVIGLIDVRLNPQLYKKYWLNYALSTGSNYNDAVMWADRHA